MAAQNPAPDFLPWIEDLEADGLHETLGCIGVDTNNPKHVARIVAIQDHAPATVILIDNIDKNHPNDQVAVLVEAGFDRAAQVLTAHGMKFTPHAPTADGKKTLRNAAHPAASIKGVEQMVFG